MSILLQFVDKIDVSPIVRLDLNDQNPFCLIKEGTDFGFPELDRAIVSTVLEDGAQIPASAYGLRELTLRLSIVTDSCATTGAAADLNAEAQQDLYRELNRPNNILKYSPNTTEPVFFRTFRSSPENVLQIIDGATHILVVTLLAEPFAIGLRETLATETVNNDPAAASNGRFFDVLSPKGDVETPLFLEVDNANQIQGNQSVFGIRRDGTVANVPFLLQAEDMIQGQDTTVQANDPNMSGAGSNWSQTTFAGQPALEPNARLTITTFPSVASVDNRGTYRVFVRLRLDDIGEALVQLRYGTKDGDIVENELVRVIEQSGLNTDMRMYDLGLWPLPVGSDPIHTGFTNEEIAVNGSRMQFFAELVSGTPNLDIDYFIFVPADDRLSFVDWSFAGGSLPTDVFILDGPNQVIYDVDASGNIRSLKDQFFIGGLPVVTPNVENRIFFIQDVALSDTGIPEHADVLSDSEDITPSYWPRYLYIRPELT